MIRAGIIGWNENSKKMIDALHLTLRDTEIIAVATTNKKGRDYAVTQLGIKHIFDDYKHLLELHQIEILCICSDPERHVDHVAAGMKAGYNILLDHPGASNVDESRKIEEIVKSHPSLKCLIAFPRRYNPRLLQLKSEINKGTFGEIVQIQAKTVEPIDQTIDFTKAENRLKGIFMDVMLQDIDLIHWLSGSQIESVYSVGNAMQHTELIKSNDADTAISTAQLKSGALVNFISSRVANQGKGLELTIIGTKGQITVSENDKNSRLISGQKGTSNYLPQLETQNNYLPVLADLVDAVKKGNHVKVDMSVSTEATKVAVAMTKSFLLNKVINL